MKVSIKKGFGFGLTSGIITTLGLVVGLNAGTHSDSVIIGAIMVIAVADALSDALGMHISEESENHHTSREIWASTAATFLTKFLVALTFIVPVLLLDLSVAIMVSIAWGLGLIAVFSYYLSRREKANSVMVIAEHLIIAVLVIVITDSVGRLVDRLS